MSQAIGRDARRVAVIGAGISGLGAAWRLSTEAKVTLIEAEPRLGGHARTVVAGRRGDQAVDTGFIVLNRVTYPNLVALFDELGVELAESNMSFGVSARGGKLEYGLAGLPAIFATPAHAVHPSFLRMVRDMLRFNARAEAVVDDEMTIGALCDRLGLGTWFRDYYLTPFSGAIWSTPTRAVLEFPARALVRFFRNHGLLGYTTQHQWYTPRGGSISYVDKMAAGLRARGVELRTGTRVAGIRRRTGRVEVRAWGGEWESYDDVVLATHSDQALALLSDAGGVERTALSAIRFQPNEAVLHADASVMPRRRKVWSSWVYSEDASRQADAPIGLTYWMNSLQPIPMDDPMFVTLNGARPVREDLIYDSATFHHPVFDRAAWAAQDTISAINGMHNTWFAGAWLRNGFHEDGLASGLAVADEILAPRMRPEVIAAE